MPSCDEIQPVGMVSLSMKINVCILFVSHEEYLLFPKIQKSYYFCEGNFKIKHSLKDKP